jgi:Ca2+-transporting ATPase
MTMVREHKGRTIGYMKGAVEAVLAACSSLHRDGRAVPLDEAARKVIAAKVEEFSAAALRVIALAYRDFPTGGEELPVVEVERDFVFAGLVAMIDPPRPGVPEAVAEVAAAQVRIFMLTGDDPRTAEAIAARIGMGNGRVLTGDELRQLPSGKLQALLRGDSLVFSRVSPGDKLLVVKQLKQLGNVVAVTGDGVNDTLSLKQADIGVAMGKLGAEVAKEASEIVLTDDDFTTLVTAVREGRKIFQNLRNVILSSLTSNIGELSCVCLGFAGTTFGLPLPISAVQILSIDLIGEMLPLMALTFDPAEAGLMRQPPRKLGAHIVDARRLAELILFGALMGASGYLSFYMVLATGGTSAMAQAGAFAGIVLAQYVNILSRRSNTSVVGRHTFANRQLWVALVASFVLVSVMVSVPAIGIWFGFEPLRPQDWLWPSAGALVFLLCFEGRKSLVNWGRGTVAGGGSG